MFPIYFNYHDSTGEYIYVEESTEYRMPLPLMLKFKKYLRNQSEHDYLQPMKEWLSTLSEQELKSITKIDLHDYELN